MEGDQGEMTTVSITFTLSFAVRSATAFEYYYTGKEVDWAVYSTAARGLDFEIGITTAGCYKHQTYGVIMCRSVIPAGQTEVTESLTVIGDDIDEGERRKGWI